MRLVYIPTNQMKCLHGTIIMDFLPISMACKEFHLLHFRTRKLLHVNKGDGGSCIDFLITKSKFSFIKTNFSENGSSDHHHLIYTILKTKFKKFEPKKLIYLNFKQFDSEQFKLDICDRMSAVRTHAAYENNFVLF